MKKLLILLILILTPFLADARGLMMMGGGVKKTLVETLYVQQTTDNEYYSPGTSNVYAQKIKFSGGTVTKIKLKLGWQAANATCKIGLYSAATDGTRYGDESTETVTTTQITHQPAVWETFTFATNPQPTGDFYIRVINSDPTLQWRMGYNQAGGTNYEDTDYAAYGNGSVLNSGMDDLCFEVYTLQ
jgi:hypothetical protein